MCREFLVAVDLEGIHGVVGEPYKTMTASSDYPLACENAVKEINAVVAALFDSGADKVTVWDNHGSWNNLDRAGIDERVHFINGDTPKKDGRIFFADDHNYEGMICLGYHAMEGTVGGVLAHTFNSIAVQYYKINGVSVGELAVDHYTASEYGFPIFFVASDEAGVREARELIDGVRCVVTKIGRSRNDADFIPEDEVLKSLYSEVRAAVESGVKAKTERLALPAKMEIRYTRMEDAMARLDRLRAKGFDAVYGEDAHVVSYTLKSIADVFA